jgi:4-carboxymuconolactone decarboxylase
MRRPCADIRLFPKADHQGAVRSLSGLILGAPNEKLRVQGERSLGSFAGVTDQPTTRMAPLDVGDLDEFQADLLRSMELGPAGSAEHLYRTLLRHPGLFRRWTPFAGKLLAGKLPARDRELLILRTGWRSQAAYEWGHHVLLGREAGLSDPEIERVKVGPEVPEWSTHDAALLRAADELHDGARISDETWATLAATYDERQLLEVPMLVGHYQMVSYVINTLGIRGETGLPGLD